MVLCYYNIVIDSKCWPFHCIDNAINDDESGCKSINFIQHQQSYLYSCSTFQEYPHIFVVLALFRLPNGSTENQLTKYLYPLGFFTNTGAVDSSVLPIGTCPDKTTLNDFGKIEEAINSKNRHVRDSWDYSRDNLSLHTHICVCVYLYIIRNADFHWQIKHTVHTKDFSPVISNFITLRCEYRITVLYTQAAYNHCDCEYTNLSESVSTCFTLKRLLSNIATHIDGLMQNCNIPSALAMEMLQSCTKLSILSL